MLERIEPDALVRDKLVMVALPGPGDWVGTLRGLGAKDVLLLTRSGPSSPCRQPTHVEARYSELRDVRGSNCAVGVLNGNAIRAVVRKRYFWQSRFKILLVPLSAGLLSVLPFAFHYARRGLFTMDGLTTINAGQRKKGFLVLKLRRAAPNYRRLFAPAHLKPIEILRYIEDIDYVLLRATDKIEQDEPFKDIDILVSDADLPRLRERLGREIGTVPLDVYTETGGEGHDFNSVPYFAPDVSRRMLATAVVRPSGIRTPNPKWQYLSSTYHLIFHGKTRHTPEGTTDITPETWDKAAHYCDLVRFANEAGLPVPRSFDDLDQALRDHQAFPGKDLIGFYARRNPFVAARYVNSGRNRPGLVTFFVRDFGNGAEAVTRVSEQIRKEFRILAHGPVNVANRAAILNRIRGGNWQDPAQRTVAEPIYWFVCRDEHPVMPAGRPRRKYPNLDNQRIVDFKHRIREEAAKISGYPTRLLHASDNTDEAIEHVDAIGIGGNPEVSEAMALLSQRQT